MSSARNHSATRRKRRGSEACSPDELFDSRPSKRLKPIIKLHSAEFYDSLSKVWLTRRALRELDRRTSHLGRFRPPSVLPQINRDTGQQIQRFARHGGPDLLDLRGYPAPRAMSSHHYSNSPRSKQTKSTVLTSLGTEKTKKSSAYDKGFEQHLIDYNVYNEAYEHIHGRKTPEPDNSEWISQKLLQPRPSLSPSQFSASRFRDFKQKNERVIIETDVMSDVIPILAGQSDIPNKQNLQFTRLDPLTNGTTVNCQPDFFDGARPGIVDKKIREDIGGYIIPTAHATAPVAPNFFLEAKAPRGAIDVLKRQACYDGAIGARAMHQLQSYEQEPVYDGNAYTITTTYQDGLLKMFTTHPTQAEDGTTEYHMFQIDTWGVTGNPRSFREGATAFRNARDLAQVKRNAFISAANERARSMTAEPRPFESFHHDGSPEPIGVQDTTCFIQIESSGDHSRHSISQTDVQGRSEIEPPDAAYNLSCIVQQEATNERAGPICSDESTLESSNCNGKSDATILRLAEELQNSGDELALDICTQPIIPNKRRHKEAEKTSSKALRKS